MTPRKHQPKLRANAITMAAYEEISKRMPGHSQAEITTAAMLTFEALLLSSREDLMVKFRRLGTCYEIGSPSHREGSIPIQTGRPKQTEAVMEPIKLKPVFVPTKPPEENKPKESLVSLKGSLGFGNTKTHGA